MVVTVLEQKRDTIIETHLLVQPETYLWRVAARKLDQIDSVLALAELKIPPGNRLEALTADRAGQHSIRINDQYRICFVWTDKGPDRVEICDYY